MNRKLFKKIAAFVVPGLFSAWLGGLLLIKGAAPEARDWLLMQSWQPTEARVIKQGRGGDDSALLSTAQGAHNLAYRYDFDGRTFINSRLWIGAPSSNEARTLWQALARAEREGRLIRIWVDPVNPFDSVVDRRLNWGTWITLSSFAMLFIGVGLVLVWVGAWYWPRQVRVFASSTPWLAKSCWSKNQIPCDREPIPWVCFGLALGFTVLSLGLIPLITSELAEGDYAVLATLLFPAAGLFFWLLFFRLFFSWNRHGTVYLSLTPMPGRIAGEVKGFLDIARQPYQAQHQYRATLRCLHRSRLPPRSDVSARQYTIWQYPCKTTVIPGARGTRVKFHCRVPAGLPSSEPQQSGYHCWQLKVTSDELDFIRSFEIPVFGPEHIQRNGYSAG